MFQDFSQLPADVLRKIVTAAVVPRPIALVTTRNPDGSINAAPFSYFNIFCESPPIVALGLAARPSGELKDTGANIRATGEFVVHLVDEELARRMVDSAAPFEPGVSEIEPCGFTLAKSVNISTDWIVEAPIAFECKLTQEIALSETRDLVLGEIVGMHARDGIYDTETFRLDWEQYYPIGRLFADGYVKTDEKYALPLRSVSDVLKTPSAE